MSTVPINVLSEVPDLCVRIASDLDTFSYVRLASTCKVTRSCLTTLHNRQNSYRAASAALSALFEQRRNVFLTGGAGFGKSYTIDRIVNHARNQLGWNVAVTSMTGMASLALHSASATTLHKWAGLGLATQSVEQMKAIMEEHERALMMDDHSSRKRVRASFAAWRKTDLLIVDEVSMLGKRLLDVLQFIANAAAPQRSPFGQRRPFEADEAKPYTKKEHPDVPLSRMLVVLVGDFFQLRPVGDHFCFFSEAWKALDLVTIELQFCVRQSTDLLWAGMLTRMRTGQLTERDVDVLRSRCTNHGQSWTISNIAVSKTKKRGRDGDGDDEQVGNPALDAHAKKLVAELKKPNKTLLPVHLVCKHAQAHAVNLAFLNAYPDSRTTWYIASDLYYRIVTNENGFAIPKSLTPDEIAALLVDEKSVPRLQRYNNHVPQTVPLREGCQYLLTHNSDTTRGLVNGLRCKYVAGKLWGKYFTHTGDYKFMALPERAWSSRSHLFSLGDGVMLRREQIPLRLGYAITVHASQGMSLEEAYVDLTDAFTAGQGYVACSRVSTLDGLKLAGFNERSFQVAAEVSAFYRGEDPAAAKEQQALDKKRKRVPRITATTIQRDLNRAKKQKAVDESQTTLGFASLSAELKKKPACAFGAVAPPAFCKKSS